MTARGAGTLLALALVGLAGTRVAASEAALLGTPRRCARYPGVPLGFGPGAHAGMVYVPAGRFVPGSSHGYPEERGDGQAVQVQAFFVDRTEVTNAQFAAFVRATGHVTEAERGAGGAVFRAGVADGALSWWRAMPGASWRHPRGPGSDLRGKHHHPVVQVSYADALAYAQWLGHTLPGEHAWEYAARAQVSDDALDRAPRDARGRPTANFWQGVFPDRDQSEDGFAGTAPVGCFGPSALGLYDMLGNVWEWTRDRYAPTQRAEDRIDDASAHCAPADPAEAAARRVLKGGSFLCAPSSCARYRASARHPQQSSQAAQHVGFRTVRPAP